MIRRKPRGDHRVDVDHLRAVPFNEHILRRQLVHRLVMSGLAKAARVNLLKFLWSLMVQPAT